jgi:hypothetical protein
MVGARAAVAVNGVDDYRAMTMDGWPRGEAPTDCAIENLQHRCCCECRADHQSARIDHLDGKRNDPRVRMGAT